MNFIAQFKKVSLYAILIFGAICTLVPFYWMFTLSTHSTTEILSFPPPLFPGGEGFHNYLNLVEAMPFFSSLWNSFFTSSSHTLLVLLFCSMGGYAFAMYDFPGKNVLFAFLLATLMIPWRKSVV